MAPFDQSRHSLVPEFLYSSKALSHLDSSINNNHGLPLPPSTTTSFVSHSSSSQKNVMIPAPKESIRMFSPAYYAACSGGGVFSCGLTHMAVTPLDLVKCNMQAVKKIGVMGLFTRGLPLRIAMIGTLTGAQWGLYDLFKVFVGLPTSGGSAPAPAK